MANRRQGYGGGGRSYYNSGPVNPWQVGNAPGNQGGHFNNGSQANLLSQLSEPQAQLALAITKLLQPQQQVPSLLTMNTVNPLQNRGGYGPNNNYPQRGRGNNMNNRRPRPDMKPYNKMNSRNNRDTDFNRRRANSNKKSQPQQRNTVVSKPKKPSSTKASSKSPGKTTEVKKAPTVKEETDEQTPTADTTETAVKESDDKSEDVESSDKKRDWKEEKNENDEAEAEETVKEDPTEEAEPADKEKTEETTTTSNAKSGKYNGIPKELLHCHICQKKMWDGESFEKHMNGRAHMQMFEKVEESYRIKADMMREAIRLAEEKHNIEMDRMKRLGKKTKTQQLSRCAMCDLDFYGQLFVHRKSPSHQKLKHFLHPRCSYCNKEFPTRMEWENHRHTGEHLRKKSENMDKKKTKSSSAGTDDEGILIEDECFIVIDSTESDDPEETNAVVDLTDDISEVPEIQIPSYKPNRAVGLSLISPVSGFFCKPCSRFFQTEKASQQHAQSKPHFDAFVSLLNEKVAENEEKKRKAVEEDEEDDEGNWKRRKTSKEEQENESKIEMEAEMEEEIEAETEAETEDDKDKTENGDEFYDPSETFNTTDPNDIDLSTSKNESLLNDEVWSEVDNKIDEIIEQSTQESDPEPVPPPSPVKPSPKPSRPQRAVRGRRN